MHQILHRRVEGCGNPASIVGRGHTASGIQIVFYGTLGYSCPVCQLLYRHVVVIQHFPQVLFE